MYLVAALDNVYIRAITLRAHIVREKENLAFKRMSGFWTQVHHCT